ncbi:MAG: FAD-binding oxidoreductase [Deltaproteobacteria bacterium]|nr:FAD-binding oxidoreductase [Deltaproteobacteria bacterium]
MSKRYDVIIIGAGIIGACVGFELAQKGYQTLNVDKLHAAGAGSTSASCAIVRAHYSTRDGVAMAYEGFSTWRNWEEYLEVKDPTGMARYKNTGSLLLKSQGHDWRKVVRHYQDVGVEFEEWSVQQVNERMPIYDLHEYWPPTRPEDDRFGEKPTAMLEGAIYCPGGGYMSDPQLSTHNVQVACQAKGGEFLYNVEVTKIRRDGGRVLGVSLKDGEQIDAPVVVNVAGPHSFIINRLAGVEGGMKIKTKALRHEVHHVPSPEGFDFEDGGIHTSDGDGAIYFRPEVGNHILVGSEDPECDPQEWVEDPDNFNRSVTDAQYKAQVYRLAKRIPSLGIPRKQQGIVDLYDVSDDWIPIYDKSDLKGFYMAVGSSGNQYKNAPVAGMIMAELIDQAEKFGLDHDKTPLQFTLPDCGMTIDVGFFSRLREINPDSSFSVNG